MWYSFKLGLALLSLSHYDNAIECFNSALMIENNECLLNNKGYN